MHSIAIVKLSFFAGQQKKKVQMSKALVGIVIWPNWNIKYLIALVLCKYGCLFSIILSIVAWWVTH